LIAKALLVFLGKNIIIPIKEIKFSSIINQIMIMDEESPATTIVTIFNAIAIKERYQEIK